MMAAMPSQSEPRPATTPAARSVRNDPLIAFDAGGTLLFTITAVIAAALFDTPTRWIAAVTALVLFAIGIFAFLWGYWTSVQRSRTEEISVAELYFLLGLPTPKAVKLRLNAFLVVQCVVAVATALARSSTNGEPGSSLAFGILVPMFGIGINGLWAARFATFGPRRLKDRTTTTGDGGSGDGNPPPGPEMEQNARHG